MKQKFVPINDAERDWIAASIANARTLVAAACPENPGIGLTPHVLDAAYKHWLTSEAEIETEANDVVHAIGFAFGQFLVDHDGFEWVLVTDQYGTDVGVRDLPGKGDVLVCPASVVAKRWETKETDFLVPVYRAVIDQRNSVRQSWDSAKGSPWWKLW